MKTTLEFDDKNKLDPTFYIEVGIQFDNHLIRKKLLITKDELDINTIGLDIKNIMCQLKSKQIELLKELEL